MPQQQQTTVMQQQRQKSPLAGIFGMVSNLVTPFLGPEAGAAAHFLSGIAGGDTGQASSAVADMIKGGGASGSQQPGPKDSKQEAPNGSDQSPQPPEQSQQGFVGPQVEQGGAPQQIPGQMPQQQGDQQQQQKDQVFQMIEKQAPDLPLLFQQNPNVLPGLRNFLSDAEMRWLNNKPGGNQNG